MGIASADAMAAGRSSIPICCDVYCKIPPAKSGTAKSAP